MGNVYSAATNKIASAYNAIRNYFTRQPRQDPQPDLQPDVQPLPRPRQVTRERLTIEPIVRIHPEGVGFRGRSRYPNRIGVTIDAHTDIRTSVVDFDERLMRNRPNPFAIQDYMNT